MHIVMVSDVEAEGGAAVAAGRFATAFVQKGHDVTMITLRPDSKPHAWRTIALPADWFSRTFARAFFHRVRSDVSERRTLRRMSATVQSLQPDVINIHNIHNAYAYGWSSRLLHLFSTAAPTFWTLHDMWTFTGRCAYSGDCEKYLTHCDWRCPTSHEYPALNPLQIGRSFHERESILSSTSASAIAPSLWMRQAALAGLWRSRRVEHISNGLPLSTYRPLDRAEARSRLGITGPAPFVLVASHYLADKRKGGDIIADVVESAAERPFSLIVVGHDVGLPEIKGAVVHSLGYIDDEERMVLALNAADVLLHPAPIDNLPNVVMEAIACGTPVVAFRTGGVPEMVRPGVTGWLAETISVADLARTLASALRQVTDGADFRKGCREVAEREYDVDLQAQRYLAAFKAVAVL
jgi:glycosyltransferase involved in cell wall biosynthesis